MSSSTLRVRFKCCGNSAERTHPSAAAIAAPGDLYRHRTHPRMHRALRQIAVAHHPPTAIRHRPAESYFRWLVESPPPAKTLYSRPHKHSVSQGIPFGSAVRIALRREPLKRRISSLFGKAGQRSRRDLAKGFLVTCVSSPNGRYLLGWQAANGSIMGDGTAAPADARYFLLDDGELVVEGRMGQPAQGKVANTGTFVLHDQAPLAQGLRAVFYGFRRDGQTVVSHGFRAALFSNGLSRDGRFAACQLCSPPDDHGGGALTIFDLERGGAIASWKPESGGPADCEFGQDGRTLSLLYPDGRSLRYTFSGRLVDTDRVD